MRIQELCEQGGGPWLFIPFPILPPSLISHAVSEDVKHHETKEEDGGPSRARLLSHLPRSDNSSPAYRRKPCYGRQSAAMLSMRPV